MSVFTYGHIVCVGVCVAAFPLQQGLGPFMGLYLYPVMLLIRNPPPTHSEWVLNCG